MALLAIRLLVAHCDRIVQVAVVAEISCLDAYALLNDLLIAIVLQGLHLGHNNRSIIGVFIARSVSRVRGVAVILEHVICLLLLLLLLL